jgi:hypothetical protein
MRANTELNINQKNSQNVLQQTIGKIKNKFG